MFNVSGVRIRMMASFVLWPASMLLLCFTLTFFLAALIPGDPVENICAGSQLAVQDADKNCLRTRLGLDKALFYFSIDPFTWQGLDNRYHSSLKDLFKGKLVRSTNRLTSYHCSCYAIWNPDLLYISLRKPFVRSAVIAFITLLLAFGIGGILAILAIVYPSRWMTGLLSLGLPILDAFPTYSIALLIWLFAGGIDYPTGETLWQELGNPFNWWVLLLAAIAYTLSLLAYITKMVLAHLREVMDLPFIVASKARGLSNRFLILRHVLPNAAFPMIADLISLSPALVAGTTVLERVFGIEGVGMMILTAIYRNQAEILLATVCWMGIFTVLINRFALRIFSLLDPRLP